jgi:hypothetical protein
MAEKDRIRQRVDRRDEAAKQGRAELMHKVVIGLLRRVEYEETFGEVMRRGVVDLTTKRADFCPIEAISESMVAVRGWWCG